MSLCVYGSYPSPARSDTRFPRAAAVTRERRRIRERDRERERERERERGGGSQPRRLDFFTTGIELGPINLLPLI